MHVATQGCLRGTAARLNPPPPPPLALYFCLLLAPFCFLISFPGTHLLSQGCPGVRPPLSSSFVSLCLSLPLSHFPPPFAWLQCRRPRRIPLLGPLRAFRFIWSRVGLPCAGRELRKGRGIANQGFCCHTVSVMETSIAEKHNSSWNMQMTAMFN